MIEALGTEVSAKIRQAIKAKLVELDAFIDEELPDYIMVMVANKKSPEAMKEDLRLFLSENTDTFVSWLGQVLEKLKKVTLGNEKRRKKKMRKTSESGAKAKKAEKKRAKAAGEKKTKKAKVVVKKKASMKEPASPSPRRSSSRSISLSSEERSPSPLIVKRKQMKKEPRQQIAGSSTSKTSPRKEHKHPSSSTSNKTSQSKRATRPAEDETYDPEQMLKTALQRRPHSPKESRKRRANRSPTLSHDKSPVKKRGLQSTVGKVITNESDGEYDHKNVSKRSSLVSEVKVCSRPTRKDDANRSLVFKAVADAGKSIAEIENRKSIERSIHETKQVRSLSSREEFHARDSYRELQPRQKFESRQRKSAHERITDNEDLRRELSSRRHSNELAYSGLSKKGLTVVLQNDARGDDEEGDDEVDDKVLELMRQRALESMLKGKAKEQRKTTHEILSKVESEENEMEDEEELDEAEPGSPISSKNTMFIVTLDGIGKDYFKKKFPETESRRTVKKSIDSIESSSPAAKDPKILVKKEKAKNIQVISPSCNQVTIKKPEAKVAPLQAVPTLQQHKERKKISAPSQDRPNLVVVNTTETKAEKKETSGAGVSSMKKGDTKASEPGSAAKPKRTRITAPSPEPEEKKPVVPIESPKIIVPKPTIRPSVPLTAKPIVNMGTHKKEICRFWPKCVRGKTCFYLHPITKKPSFPPQSTTYYSPNRFKWKAPTSL